MGDASDQPPVTAPPLSDQLVGGRYRLEKVLGRGGMGVVYAATQESLSRPIAVKMLLPIFAEDADAVLRFRAEAERAGRLSHPHIAQILDFGHDPGGSAWIAMERLDGESLGARLARGPMTGGETIRVALEVLSALEAAHSERIVHRDIKPDNIFLADVRGIGTTVKVLDFGIAKLLDEQAGKLTATGMMVGTPNYMAPEQAKGLKVDDRADLYALGAVMYEALGGRPPFQADNYNALLFAVLTDSPPPLESLRPGVSPALVEIISKAMAREPEARFEGARAMAVALSALGGDTEIPPTSRQAVGVAPTLATPTPARATAPLGGQGESPRAVEPITSPPAAAASSGRTAYLGLAVAALFVAAATAVVWLFLRPSGEREPDWDPLTAPGGTAAHADVGPTPDDTRPMEPIAGDDGARSMGDDEDESPTDVDADEDDDASPDDDAEEAVVAARGPSRPRVRRPARYPTPPVRATSFSTAGMSSTRDVRGPVQQVTDWATCWPTTEPAPEMNRSRLFYVDIAADGRVVAASPHPASREPAAFARCVVPKLERLRFPETATGEEVRVQVGFSIGN